MQFRTELPADRAPFSVTHTQGILAIGSCFAENIGDALAFRQFDIVCNPFGIVYHAAAIAAQLSCIMQSNFCFDESHLLLHNELWHSPLHHSRYAGTDKIAVLAQINSRLAAAQAHWQKTEVLLLTLGTAQVFVDKKTGNAVANCHKRPASDFEQQQQTVADTIAVLTPVFEALLAQKPQLQIILTVSPVRYLREGLLQSAYSKATLLLATAALTERFAQCHYFAAYQYLIDDLRDYRYYADDMLHPSAAAIRYIWQKFSESYFNIATQQLNTQIENWQAARQHRLQHPDTAAAAAFVAQLTAATATLHRDYPFLRERLPA